MQKDFIPLVLEKGLDQALHDEMVDIPDGVAVSTSQSLARNEGILTGISGGATMWAAVETAKKAPEGSVIVAMLPGELLTVFDLYKRLFDFVCGQI